jgi:hypothetical protein
MPFFSRKRLLVAGSTVVAFTLMFYAAQYRQYAYARAWHFSHGDSIRFGDRTLALPGQWWAKKSNGINRVYILRAVKAEDFLTPKIDVSPAIGGGEAADNSDELLRLANRTVALDDANPQQEWKHSVISFRAKSATWCCIKYTQTILGQTIATSLTCNTPNVPYTLSYQGPPEFENEATSIISTFQ